MTEKKETKRAEIIEGELINRNPTPLQIKLVTAADCKREMAKVYRDARMGKLEVQNGTEIFYSFVTFKFT